MGRRAPAVLAALALLGVSPPADSVKLTASKEGFRPAVLTARRGETLRILVTTADEEHCFALDAFRIEKRIVPGRTVSVDVTPDRSGTFPFHCCLEEGSQAIHGELRVTE
jgi:cytochrome c oxidase subunit 2